MLLMGLAAFWVTIWEKGYAQTPPLPTSVQDTLGSQRNIDAGTLLNYSQKTLQSEEKKPEAPEAAKHPEIQVVPLPEKPDTADTTNKFILNAVSIHGVSVLDDKEIPAIVKPYVGNMVSIDELVKVKNDLTQLYASHGYITSRAFLVPQEIADGKVALQVVEGKVANIEIVGLKHLKQDAILHHLKPLQGKIFNVQQLEQALRKINESPLVKVKANIRPGEHFGTSDIVIFAEEADRWDFNLFSDNQGRKNIGFYRSGFTLENRNLIGIGDHATLSGIGSLSEWGQGGTQGLFGTYAVPLGQTGIQIGTAVSAGHVDVGGSLKDLNINGRSYTIGLFVNGPLWKGRTASLSWDVGVDSKRSLQFLDDVRFPDLGIPNTEVRMAHAGLTLDMLDKLGRTTLQNQVSQGIHAFGGTTAFFKYNADLTRIQPLFRGATLIGRLGAQLTPNNLVSMEQFQIGGAQTVRGYQEGALIGDQGFFSSVELRLPLSFFADRWSREIEMLGFFDAGNVGMTRIPLVGGSAGTPGNIRSLGFGVRARLFKQVVARLDSGFGFGDDNEEPTARIHFGLSSNLF